MIKVEMVKKDDCACNNPYDLRNPSENKQDPTRIWHYIKFYVPQDSKEHSHHEQKGNCHWKPKVSLEPSPEGKMQPWILIIKTLRSILVGQCETNDPTGNKQNDKLIIVCKFLLELAELFLESFASLRLAKDLLLVDRDIEQGKLRWVFSVCVIVLFGWHFLVEYYC